MADETDPATPTPAPATPKRSAPKRAPAAESVSTKRMVLRRENVLVIPDGLDPKKLADIEAAVKKALGAKGKPTQAWVPLGEFEGSSNTNAIEAYAGKPGTPDAIPGTYKAPSIRSWAGGEVYDKPPLPKVERKPLVD